MTESFGQKNRRRRIAPALRALVYERDCGRCVVCGSTVDLTVDHRIPLARGGGNRESNLQTMCGPCNRRKGCDTPTEVEACSRFGPHGEVLI